MLEILVVLTAIGIVLSSRHSLGPGNPFQIYFMTWFLVFFVYYLTSQSFIVIKSEFLLALVFPTVLSLFLLIFHLFIARTCSNQNSRILSESIFISNRTVFFGQLFVTLILPFIYQRAQFLSGGESVFSILGYMQLRGSMTNDGESYGVLAYAFVFSFIVTSLSAVLYARKEINFIRFSLAIIVSLFYVYMSTGRTFVLLFFCLTLIPLVVLGFIRFRGLVLFIVLLISLFVFVASMTSKGVSVDDGIGSNVDSFLINLRGYTIAPLVGFLEIMGTIREHDYGSNSFRIVYALMHFLGITKDAPVTLVRDFVYVPDPTNVYTVYEVYFRDFSFLGLLIPSLFLLGHFWLYRQARRFGGVWIFYYGASIYPLIMQFFQDQYFSLLSQWGQVGFWYWFFLGRKQKAIVNLGM